MATIEVQREIKRTLSDAGVGLSMSDLVDRIQQNTAEPAISIRAAVLPLISLHEVELTPDRKLRLVSVGEQALTSVF